MAWSTNLVYWACREKNENVLEECVELGLDLNQRNGYLNTPLIAASFIPKNENIIKLLLNHYQTNINTIDILGFNAWGRCLARNKITEEYFRQNGACAPYCNFRNFGLSALGIKIINNIKSDFIPTIEEINEIDQRGLTPFLWSIWWRNEIYFDIMLKAGAEVNKAGANGVTALMLAVLQNREDFVLKLVINGADLNQEEDNGFTALAYLDVGQKFNPSILDFLIDHGAKIDYCGKNGKTPFMLYVLQNRRMSDLDYFFKRNDINFNVVDEDGNSILSYAILNKNLHVASRLIKCGAQVDACGPKGKTPLAWSIFVNNAETIELLINSGADINFIDGNGKTALNYAIQLGYENIVELLLENNSKIHLVNNKQKQSPLLQAINQKNEAITKLLLLFYDEPIIQEFPSPLERANQLQLNDVVNVLQQHSIEEMSNILIKFQVEKLKRHFKKINFLSQDDGFVTPKDLQYLLMSQTEMTSINN